MSASPASEWRARHRCAPPSAPMSASLGAGRLQTGMGQDWLWIAAAAGWTQRCASCRWFVPCANACRNRSSAPAPTPADASTPSSTAPPLPSLQKQCASKICHWIHKS